MKKKQLSEIEMKKLGQKISRGFDFLTTGLKDKKLTKEKALGLFQELLSSLYNTGVVNKQVLVKVVHDLPSQKPKPNEQDELSENKITIEDVRELYELLNILKEVREEEENKEEEPTEEEPTEEEPKEEPKEEEPEEEQEEEPKEEIPPAEDLVSALLQTSVGKKFSRFVDNSDNAGKAEMIIQLSKKLPGLQNQTTSNILRKYFSN